VNGTGSGLYTMACFHISLVEPVGSGTRELINYLFNSVADWILRK
jgi:hypothetical protein